jgi:hypothetical protein
MGLGWVVITLALNMTGAGAYAFKVCTFLQAFERSNEVLIRG